MSLKHYFLLTADALPWTESNARAFLFFYATASIHEGVSGRGREYHVFWSAHGGTQEQFDQPFDSNNRSTAPAVV